MLKNEVLASLENNPVVLALEAGKDNIGNLNTTEEALILAAAYQKHPQNYIVVKKDKYAAQQLYDRLLPLCDNTLLFVMEESLRVQAIASSPEEKEEQISALIEMTANDTPKIVVCNTAGFLRYLPQFDFFKSLCFSLKQDQQMDMKTLKQKLNRAGYAKVNYVDRPCTYASRGGIIDIFSLQYDHPVRIEFFDTEIDNIRFFDEKTQRTISQVQEVQIDPATDLLFTDDQIKEILEKTNAKLEKECKGLDEESAAMLKDYVEQDQRSLENFDIEPHLYWYFSYVNSSSLLDYIRGTVILSNREEIERAEKNLNKDNISFIQEMSQEHKALPQYMMFHDLYKQIHKEKTVSVHQFEDMNDPVRSGIIPVMDLQHQLYNFLSSIEKDVYLAVGEEGKKKIEALGNFPKVHFSDSEFYEGFETDQYTVYTDRELFKVRPKLQKYQKTFKEGQMLQNVLELEPNDYVVHGTYGIGQYVGIVTRKQNNKTLDYLHILYRGGDDLYVPLSQFQLVRKFISKEGAGVKLSALGSNQWQKTKEKVSKKVEEIAARLVELYANRNENIGFAYPKDDALQMEFEDAFEYDPTPDQIQAVEEIKREMEKPKPMDHLLCGDVGFGKTEVAMRCAFKAIAAGKQVAVLCPTTVLSMQHMQTFSKRFEHTGANIALLNRFTPAKEVKRIKEDLEDGKIDIIIGTHRLFNKSIKYKDLGFLIIDEEQRFGVEHKEKIKEMKNSIDVLSLSATPIPRTLQMSLIGVRTISQLNTPPAHRHPVQTYVLEKKPTIVEEVIQRELSRSGQVFYLFNRVSQIYNEAKKIQKAFPDANVAVAHGQMSREEIEQTMMDFQDGKYDILVCTTIIETGLDIANANTIIIEDADRFGLSQLYQIRGRVGRREKLAYCYLMVRPEKELTEQAQKRLKSIKEFTSLGSGYKIAMRDLTIRGAGDMLGPQQAGFIDQVGMDMYLEMLSEAIARKQGKIPEVKKEMKTAQIQLDAHIPSIFTDNDGDKLSLYQDIKQAQSFKELAQYEERIRDLFGVIPKEVEKIFKQRKLDLFVNEEGIDSLKEEKDFVILTLDEKSSSQIDGVKLFNAISAISNTIVLKMIRKKIVIRISTKKKNYMSLLDKVIETVQGMLPDVEGSDYETR